MAKAAKVIGIIAGAVAIVATAGAVLLPGLAIAGVGLATIGTAAGLVAFAASTAGQMLTKPPPARGSVTQVLVTPDAPQPYVIGEGLFAGVLRHQAAYGATLNDVPNPYLGEVVVYSGGGPVESISPRVDLDAVGAWYSGYLYTDTQLGATPEAAALTPNYAGLPGWDATSKLSGQAAILWNFLFDKAGKRFASGLPRLGAYAQWVKSYDPRLDDTFPGGAGAHRIDDETTWEWSENPALHAGTYAYGRYQNGKRTIGVGLPADGIDWVTIAAWANVCDANLWSIFGVIYEPGDRWAALKDICIAGGAEPAFAGGLLSFKYAAPKVALDTVTEADLADDDYSACAMASWRERVNTIVPKYRSPDHEWELVQAEAVSVSTYVTEDGEVKQVEWPFNFVKDADQAAQLAAYRLVDARELQPITLVCGPRMRAFRPGECLDLDIPSLGLDTPAVLIKREFDPSRMTVTMTFIGETAAKHAYALGLTGTPPPTPALGQTAEERDELAAAANNPGGFGPMVIRSAAIKSPRNSIGTPSRLLTGVVTGGGDGNIAVAFHDWDYPGDTADVTRDGAIITGLTPGDTYYVYFDDPTLADTTPSYLTTTSPATAQNSTANPNRHSLGEITLPALGGPDTEGGDNLGYGFPEDRYS